MRVVIVGAGIAGLSLAIALEPLGADVEVIERELEWTTAGAAITLRPLAVKALRRLGVVDDVVAAGRVVDRQRYVRVSGEVVGERVLSDEGEVTVVIHRRVLQRVLGSRVGRVAVRMGGLPVAVETDRSSVAVTLSSGERRRCDVVVGADGVHSWLRGKLFRDAIVRPAHQQYWRFCVDGELSEDWCVMLETARFVALLPVPGMTYCAAQVCGSAQLDEPVDPRSALFQIFGHYPSPVAEVLARVTPATEIHFGPTEEVILPHWSSGPVGLIGDAAHALSPVLTLGGGLAIEDAVVLAEELQRGRPPSASLVAFGSRRQPRVELARQLANQRVAAIAGQVNLDEDNYQRRSASLLQDP